MKNSSIQHCKIIDLPKISTTNGNISAIEGIKDIPFDIRRIYYLYDIPGNSQRGGHAHKNLHQLVISALGSFDIVIDDGTNQKTFTLNRPYFGLYIVPGIWRELQNFSSGSICLVLASDIFKEEDYIRDYNEFIGIKRK